jgi:hypothetical protein
MHRFVSQIVGMGLAAQSAWRQPKIQMRLWAKHRAG